MSTFPTVPLKIRLKETEEEMKSYPGVTDAEAHVMAMCILIPRGWDHFLMKEGISEKKIDSLFESGVKKYIAGGGRDYWCG